MEDIKISFEDFSKMPAEMTYNLFIQQMEMIKKLNQNIETLTEQIRLLSQRQYGRKTETVSSLQLSMTFDFNEAEAECDLEAEEEPIEEVVRTYSRKPRRKGKLEEDLSRIPTKTVIPITIPEEVLEEKFHGKYKRLPDEIYHKVEYHPAWFEVLEYHIQVVAGTEDETILRADRPSELFSHSYATPSMVAAIMNAKYSGHLPLNRQSEEFKQFGLNLSRQTMANWVIRTYERYLSLLIPVMKKKLLDSSIIHGDETPVEVRKDGREKIGKSYMWVYRTADGKVVLYNYEKTRGSIHPKTFLGEYGGTLVCDGYQAYHALAKGQPDLKVAGCWSHCKRKFTEVVKANSEYPKKASLAGRAVLQISNIYSMDNSYKEEEYEKRLEIRQTQVKKLVDAFFAWAKSNQNKVEAESGTGKAIQYALNQEEYLRTFLDDPEIPLDNNAAERAIRPFTIGRKNWYLIDTLHGAEASAGIYSIVETAKANNLKVYAYLKYVLEEIPKHMDEKDMAFTEGLLPWSNSLPSELYKDIK